MVGFFFVMFVFCKRISVDDCMNVHPVCCVFCFLLPLQLVPQLLRAFSSFHTKL